jgi:ATP-dependent Lon protease
MRLPLYVGRRLSVGAVSHAVAHDLPLFLIAQRQSAAEQPKACDLYTVGTLATVVKRLPLDNGSMKIEVMARERARLVGLDEQADRIDGRAEILAEPEGDGLQSALSSLVPVFGRVLTPGPLAHALEAMAAPQIPRPGGDAVMAAMQDVLEGPATSVADRLDRLRAALAAIAA